MNHDVILGRVNPFLQVLFAVYDHSVSVSNIPPAAFFPIYCQLQINRLSSDLPNSLLCCDTVEQLPKLFVAISL